MLLETSSAAEFCSRFLAQKHSHMVSSTKTSKTITASAAAADATAAAPLSSSADGTKPTSETATLTLTTTTTTTTTTTSASPQQQKTITTEQLDKFKTVLTELLVERCQSSNWDPRAPLVGNAYRAISCFAPNSNIDRLFLQAGKESGIDESVLIECLPKDFVIWVDPGSVAYRVGDYGNIVTLVDQGRVVPPVSMPPSTMPGGTITIPRGVPHTSGGTPHSAAAQGVSSSQHVNPYLAANLKASTTARTSAATISAPFGWQFQQQQHQYEQQQQYQQHQYTPPVSSPFVFVTPVTSAVRITSPPSTPPQTTKRQAVVVN